MYGIPYTPLPWKIKTPLEKCEKRKNIILHSYINAKSTTKNKRNR